MIPRPNPQFCSALAFLALMPEFQFKALNTKLDYTRFTEQQTQSADRGIKKV